MSEPVARPGRSDVDAPRPVVRPGGASETVARPVDPDVDLSDPEERAELRPSPWPVLAAIAAGGVLGALARHGLVVAFPHEAADFDRATFAINTSGCLLIGVLMELVGSVWAGRRLVRPFLGVGVLGGYTTFSAYVVDVERAVEADAPGTALLFLFASLAAALIAVAVGSGLTARLLRSRDRTRDRTRDRSGDGSRDRSADRLRGAAHGAGEVRGGR
ncbi:putative fluoride ion transporter CrcB [Parafrankia sp. Ea1.12]|uniref:fluoride efflux transporter FluC n=1 Tax=Parafrankia sp. Ea1.12 TaxID=573499 RepID=UPI000DA49C0A|nr:CrcB family protein [Parafrankia sp. Ea1.12]SQD99406.1 putative fluoride ion transporter CrcB [Parafrankia sp. Ea1.12]